jgi:2'-5' RNA ligase
MTQAPSPGGEPKRTDRIFFAVAPDDAAIAGIKRLTADLTSRHGLRGRPIVDAKIHATLCMLGDFPGVPADVIARATRAAASVAALTPPFEVAFDSARSFLNRARNRPFVLTGDDGAAGLAALYRNLAQALRQAGVAAGSPNYTPHVTLLYDDVAVLPVPTPAVRWTVRELVLLHSCIGRQQTCYATLARWALAA